MGYDLRKLPYLVLAAAIIASLLLPATASLAASVTTQSLPTYSGSGKVHNYIIVVNDTLVMPKVLSLISKVGKVKEAHLGAGVLIASGSDVVEDILRGVGGVAVAKDYKVQFLPPPSELLVDVVEGNVTADPYYPYQWDMMYINASPEKAWSITTGNPSIKVAILDTGVCWYHPDIAPNYDFELSTSFVTESPVEGIDDSSPMDYYGHGTWCAGAVAAALNGVGVVGVAPNVKIVNVKVLTSEGWGYWSWILEAILYCADNRINVISMSLGAYLNLSDPNDRAIYLAFVKAVQYAKAKGCVIVAAAGNEAEDLTSMLIKDNLVEVPAMLPGVIAVSAITDRYELAPYSNYGFGVIDVAAPGGYWYGYPEPGWWYHLCLNCWSPECWWSPGNYYAWMVGTSAACPHVSGVAALILSIKPHLPPTAVDLIIKTTATDLGEPGYDACYGFGLVDAYAAVKLAKTHFKSLKLCIITMKHGH